MEIVMDEKRMPCVPVSEALLWTVEEFCALHRVSMSKYYELTKEGRGPAVIYLGRSPRISRESAAEWRLRMTTKPEPPPRLGDGYVRT
jgi:hypothetical protein